MMREVWLVHHKGAFGSKAMMGVFAKIARIAAAEPVYICLEGVDEVPDEVMRMLVETCRQIGESKCRVNGISPKMWAAHQETFTSLGPPIVVPPLWWA